MADEEVQLNSRQASAGETPHIVRYVLGISLALIVILFAILLFVWR